MEESLFKKKKELFKLINFSEIAVTDYFLKLNNKFIVTIPAYWVTETKCVEVQSW